MFHLNIRPYKTEFCLTTIKLWTSFTELTCCSDQMMDDGIRKGIFALNSDISLPGPSVFYYLHKISMKRDVQDMFLLKYAMVVQNY